MGAMKKTLLATLAAAMLLAVAGQSANATEVGYSRKFGLGIVIGDPTGLSAKLWVGQTNALETASRREASLGQPLEAPEKHLRLPAP